MKLMKPSFKTILTLPLIMSSAMALDANAEISFSDDFSKSAINGQRKNYTDILTKVELKRNDFAKRLKAAEFDDEKNAIVAEAQTYLAETMVSDIVPSWYGTGHDYSGVSNIPGEGQIACGYFVSTVLHHLGFKFNRKLLGQQNSPYILQTLSHPSIIKTSWLENYEEFIADIKAEGPGVYIVGMDRHVGFVAYDGKEIAFIHSYVTVRSQTIQERSLLSISKWRSVGKIFGYSLTVKWIYGKDIEIIKPAN